MGERKGQNHYYPPDFDPVKHGNLNAYHGTHALRERARKIDQGILIIRFEMPYNIWCDGCKAHIAMGVRYNAQKSKNGKYYTTPIHKFRMKCHLCPQHFEIQTDPANMDYVILSGARRKEQRWDMKDNEQIVTEEKSDIKKLAADPMFKLEHDTCDKTKVAKLMPTLRELEEVQAQWQDDFGANSLMRSHLREEKRVIKEQADSDRKFLDKWNINVELVREHEDDKKLAKLYKFNSLDQNEKDQECGEDVRANKRKAIELESIFDSKPGKLRTSSMPQTSSKQFQLLNSKQLQIKGLKTKLNKSIQEKKLTGSDLVCESSLFSCLAKDEINGRKNGEKISSLVNLNVKNNVGGQNNNGIGNSSLVSNDYDPSSDEN